MSLRYTPEVGAQCISSACWDLCGGRPVRAVPTATKKLRNLYMDVVIFSYGPWFFRFEFSLICHAINIRSSKHGKINGIFSMFLMII